MAKLARKHFKVFAFDADVDDVGQFGSAIETTKYNTKDVEQIQALEAWSKGWVAAALSNNRYPSLQERNGVDYAISYQQAYLVQEGIPEWYSQTTYYKGSIVKQVVGDDIYFYRSIADDNTNHALSDTDYWQNYSLFNQTAIAEDLEALKARTYRIGEPIIRLDNTLYDGEIRLEGAIVSRVTYAALFEIYGTTYGAGDGLTTFQLPDFRNKVIWGGQNFGYIEAGLPDHTHVINITTTSTGADPAGTYPLRWNDGDWAWRSVTPPNTTGASASNSIYGKSNTVQPPAIKARVVTRWK